jgi:hypothetical protein
MQWPKNPLQPLKQPWKAQSNQSKQPFGVHAFGPPSEGAPASVIGPGPQVPPVQMPVTLVQSSHKAPPVPQAMDWVPSVLQLPIESQHPLHELAQAATALPSGLAPLSRVVAPSSVAASTAARASALSPASPVDVGASSPPPELVVESSPEPPDPLPLPEDCPRLASLLFNLAGLEYPSPASPEPPAAPHPVTTPKTASMQ